jgi:predicted nucleic acid-binding protein
VSSATSSSPAAYLIDTNVLLRSVEAGHPMHATAHRALQQLTNTGAALYVAPQNLIEFWVVATRPLTANGLGLTPAETITEVVNFKAAFRLLPETPSLVTEWERIAVVYSVCGKQAHDARLVAMMKIHGIGSIVTFNVGDFSRYTSGEGIAVVDPGAIGVLSP